MRMLRLLSSLQPKAELAVLLTEFAKNGDVIPDTMEAGELLDLDCDVPTEVAAEEGARDETEAESSEEEEEIVHSPIILREARACMARVAEFMQVNSNTRGLSNLLMSALRCSRN